MATIIELKEMNELIKERFYIPTYQRGYRWETQQVEDLLKDVYEFKEKATLRTVNSIVCNPL